MEDQHTPTPTDSVREQAVQNIRKRRDLATHSVVFVVFNVLLWAIWALTGGGYPWPAWITGAWAVGVIMNAWDVHRRQSITEEEIQQEMRRLRPQP